MTIGDVDRTARIRQLNDALRVNGTGGRVMMTAGIAALPLGDQVAVLAGVRAFANFDAANDPYGEHNCAVVQVGEHSIIWKIDYYDFQLEALSPDAADAAQTRRVLTVMLSSDY